MRLTLEEVKALSDEDIRIKVAELCGYTWCKTKYYGYRWFAPDGTRRGGSAPTCDSPSQKRALAHHLPNYPQDLNAMHEVEASMTERQTYLMDDWLEKLIIDGWLWRATARQRAEAFILTMEEA